MVLQALHGLSDREAAEAVTFDLRWKAAVGLPVTAAAFHPTTLTVWRNRLAASTRPHRIFEAVREVVAATGAVRGKTRRALDSTILDDAVARQDTVTQLIAAVRRVGREVPGAAELIPRVCTGYDYTRAGKPDIAWDDADAREQLVSALVNDALALLDQLSDQQRLWTSARPGWASRRGIGPSRRWRCWRWSPGRTSNRPRAATAAMGGGGSPARSPRTG